MRPTAFAPFFALLVACSGNTPPSTDPTGTAQTAASGKTDAECSAAPECQLEGKCAAKDGACIATAEGCKASGSCQMSGYCTEEGGKCVVTEASCKETVCASLGLCAGVKDGICVGSADDCRKGPLCASQGACVISQRGDTCLVDEASCKASEVCKKEGKCKPDKMKMSCEG